MTHNTWVAGKQFYVFQTQRLSMLTNKHKLAEWILHWAAGHIELRQFLIILQLAGLAINPLICRPVQTGCSTGLLIMTVLSHCHGNGLPVPPNDYIHQQFMTKPFFVSFSPFYVHLERHADHLCIWQFTQQLNHFYHHHQRSYRLASEG